MKAIIILLIFLLTLSLVSPGCVDVRQNKEFCGSEMSGMTSIEHTYLWGADGFMTKRYDVAVYVYGTPQTGTNLPKSQVDTYRQTYCSASAGSNQAEPVETIVTTIPPPDPTPVPIPYHGITDGFWCRETTMNIGKAPTEVTECFRFFPDGTYKWGYSPGWAMGKSPSCSGAANAKCVYTVSPDGKIEVEGGYVYTMYGDTLVDPHNPPYFKWSSTGIP
jgi:hypothetical protein